MPSTSISRSDYDPESRILSIWFVTTGRRYDYENVPAETYAAFQNAFAKGRFFQRPYSQSLPAPSRQLQCH